MAFVRASLSPSTFSEDMAGENRVVFQKVKKNRIFFFDVFDNFSKQKARWPYDVTTRNEEQIIQRNLSRLGLYATVRRSFSLSIRPLRCL